VVNHRQLLGLRYLFDIIIIIIHFISGSKVHKNPAGEKTETD